MNTNVNSINRAKFGYLTYNDILIKIDEGILNSYDFVFGKDTREYYIISPELEPISIKSRINIFNSSVEAIDILNQREDTYIGQLVGILDDGIYRGYIVNKNKDKFTVTALYENPNQIDYNELKNIPITNLIGTLDNMIIINALSDGVYKIKGNYKITNNSETIYLSSSGDILFINSNESSKTIKRIISDSITDFKVVDNNISTTSFYITNDFLNNSNYTTTDYVDSKLLFLETAIKNYITEYVDDIVINKIDLILEERLDTKLNELITPILNEEVNDLF